MKKTVQMNVIPWGDKKFNQRAVEGFKVAKYSLWEGIICKLISHKFIDRRRYRILGGQDLVQSGEINDENPETEHEIINIQYEICQRCWRLFPTNLYSIAQRKNGDQWQIVEIRSANKIT